LWNSLAYTAHRRQIHEDIKDYDHNNSEEHLGRRVQGENHNPIAGGFFLVPEDASACWSRGGMDTVPVVLGMLLST
jgi:hypothetical protein